VYSLLNEQVPFINPVCALLQKHIYQPIKAGEAITIGQIKIGIERPFLERNNKVAGEGKVLHTDLESICSEGLQSTAATNRVTSD
jgi:hypothetical protein